MPKTEHINGVWVAQYFVNDPIGTVNYLTNGRFSKFWDHLPIIGKFPMESA
jgi:hypothetical protein